jgi:hypothetical protein
MRWNVQISSCLAKSGVFVRLADAASVSHARKPLHHEKAPVSGTDRDEGVRIGSEEIYPLHFFGSCENWKPSIFF